MLFLLTSNERRGKQWILSKTLDITHKIHVPTVFIQRSTMKISIVALLVFATSVTGEEGAPKVTSPLGRCVMNMDCDDDDHCAGGLLCADDHKKELKAAGYNTRTADCGMETTESLFEVCFDPCILSGSCPSGGGMGGKCHIFEFRSYLVDLSV
jgi:hypothetical protein